MRRILPLLALLCWPALLQGKAMHRPALWQVADADTTIYLFGTFHALPPGYAWRDPAILRAVARSDRLVIETIVGDPAAMSKLLIELGTPPAPLPPLLDRVGPAKRSAVAALVARAGVPAGFLDRMETWAAAFVLARPMMEDLGVSGEAGVEELLKQDFTAAHRPIEGLETVRDQLGFVDGLAEADQRALLDGFVEKSDRARAEFAAMLAAWGRGDERAIAATFDRELKGSPALRAALLVRRNRNWAGAIAGRLATPGTIMVAVGAGHLAGPDSVLAMLRAQGLAVTRIQ